MIFEQCRILMFKEELYCSLSELQARFGKEAVRLESGLRMAPGLDNCLCNIDITWLCQQAGLEAVDWKARVLSLKVSANAYDVPVKRSGRTHGFALV